MRVVGLAMGAFQTLLCEALKPLQIICFKLFQSFNGFSLCEPMNQSMVFTLSLIHALVMTHLYTKKTCSD